MTAQGEVTLVEPPPVVNREHTGRRAETEADLAALAPEAQAALRQFSLDRTTGYGVDHADAVELRARVLGGQDWQSAAVELAEATARRADGDGVTPTTRIALLRRSSALLRMGQMMILTDTDDRRALFAEAAQRYARAAELAGDRERVVLDTEGGPVVGWLVPATGVAVASVVVIGGVEGWAMDFDSLGDAFSARGIDALLLDGPGQGETRLSHHHYLTADWRAAYSRAVDFLDARAPGRPLGIVGNSMGGSFAMAFAAADQRIRACVDNGGIPAPWAVPPSGTFFTKMLTFCGTGEAERGLAAWRTVTPLARGVNTDYRLLVVHGGADPLVTDDWARELLRDAPAGGREMVVFSDGDHCVYNHRNDRDALITDWTRQRLTAR
ncbi:alpha/beta hydrolase family protein [Umezawaea endophytica]|uniref:Alpha/beta hydrolase n=1 Tax=Umezawaea endophytica TaxID=1654476 RepID=A0A9X2VT88_9PSEU|nr:alpha/beta hydrolase [Umezawaea endophytica]MCS7482511.1 alpha/beta hydrolase [Umezawaea endophytica]